VLFPASVTMQTQVKLPAARVTEMSDADLEAYDRLLTELRELLPRDEPNRIGSVSAIEVIEAAGNCLQVDVHWRWGWRRVRGTVTKLYFFSKSSAKSADLLQACGPAPF
jgi:hypothetical protein